jgi:inward rectifier potassium channel
MKPLKDLHFDPGIGTKFKRPTKRIINKDGSFNVVKEGASFRLNDAYLFFINLSWGQFILVLVGGFVVMNLMFASIYVALGEGALMSDRTATGWNQWLQAYYFSTQTFTTVGYGAISPQSHLASIVASFEALVGFLSFSIATGLLFGRFSKPRARIRYSDHALIQEVDGVRSIVFRIVNERPNQLMEMSATVILNLVQPSSSSIQRTYKRLHLQIDRIEFFPLNWTLVHPIDEESPLNGMSNEDILLSDGELLIHIKGFDEMFSQELHSRYSYKLNEIIPEARFEPMFDTNAEGEIVLDLDRINHFAKQRK